MRRFWNLCSSSLWVCSVVLGVTRVHIFLCKTSMYFVLALMFSFWHCGRRKFVLPMIHLVKKPAQAGSICLKFSVKKHCDGMEFVFYRKVVLLKWYSDDFIWHLHPVWEVLCWRKTMVLFYFFSHEDICSISERVRRMVHCRRGVAAWNHYFRSQKRKTSASLSCYCLVVFQQKNLQKWGFPWSAHCYFMELRRLQQICLWRVQSKQSCCPIN